MILEMVARVLPFDVLASSRTQDTIRLSPFAPWPAMSERSESNGGDGGN